MKKHVKYLLSAGLLMSALVSHAQRGFYITPRIGMDISTLHADNDDLERNSRTGFVGGIDTEYRFGRVFGVSLGVYYSTQGFKQYREEFAGTTRAKSAPGTFILSEEAGKSVRQTAEGKGAHIVFNPDDYDAYVYSKNPRVVLGLISVPLMLNAHVWQGLTLKAGLQLDNLVSAKTKMDTEKKLDLERTHVTTTTSVRDDYETNSFSVPLAVSYTYKNIEIEARYLWGVGDIMETVRDNKLYTRTFMITAGYRFKL